MASSSSHRSAPARRTRSASSSNSYGHRDNGRPSRSTAAAAAESTNKRRSTRNSAGGTYAGDQRSHPNFIPKEQWGRSSSDRTSEDDQDEQDDEDDDDDAEGEAEDDYVKREHTADEEDDDDDEDDSRYVSATVNGSSTSRRGSRHAPRSATQIVLDSEPAAPSSMDNAQLEQHLFGDTSSRTAGSSSRPTTTRVLQDSEEDGEGEDDDEDADGDADGDDVGLGRRGSRRGSGENGTVVRLSFKATSSESNQLQAQAQLQKPTGAFSTSASGRRVAKPIIESESSEDELGIGAGKGKRRGLSREARKYAGEDSGSEPFDGSDDDETKQRRSRRQKLSKMSRERGSKSGRHDRTSSRRSGRHKDDYEDGDYEEKSYNRRTPASSSTDTDDLNLTDAESQDEILAAASGRGDGEYRLRKRNEVNYSLPVMFGLNPDGTPKETTEAAGKDKGKKKKTIIGAPKRLPFSMSGRQLSKLFGEPPDSSDDDDPVTPKRTGLLGGPGVLPAGGTGAMDFTSGTPNNLGKISGATNLADIDPLLPSSTLSFDSVGGLQSHIQQLKEMVSLPLLYPEVFQRFGITPPRGVLFHGPPGTGKTLMARALAASCSTEGQKISFFMRKGADVLSKWVGEAERQLRLLFEEAKNCQPSIIFFDEIDGLAPVRSSKQDQIHASIVSTMLALMDGMDGRGQVIVIGATNRPDAVDPALRRPGRFDREFYFPLPNLEARRKILEINTRKWDPPIREEFLDELAILTKGYGGADLRALCTEAALNAIQRKYPQIYKTADRLVIKPEEIEVVARDFMLSAQRLIPSTARSSSSLAAPLPSHLEPLLNDSLNAAIGSLSKVLPRTKQINILEEAEYEQDDGGFEQERRMQNFESLRVYRPRLLVAGQHGCGQKAVGAAILHHLEGFHVQSLDFATLVGDSARTPEAAVVQIFNEAKRHKPSILFIPALVNWANSVAESVKSTVRELLEGLEPSDPVLLLALAEEPFSDIPHDIRSWFGFLRDNRVKLSIPNDTQRDAFFQDLLVNAERKPIEYPDAMPRKKRILEQLAIAPPLPPRQPTAAELEQQAQNDSRLKEYVKFRLGPILQELKRRYKRFSKPIGAGEEVEVQQPTEAAAEDDPLEASGQAQASAAEKQPPSDPPTNGTQPHVNGDGPDDAMQVDPSTIGAGASPFESFAPATAVPNLTSIETVTQANDVGPTDLTTAPPTSNSFIFRFHDMGLDKMHERLYSDKYTTPDSFLADLHQILENAHYEGEADVLIKADQMLNQARIMLDQAYDPPFKLECERLAEREQQRAKQKAEKRQKAKEAHEAAAKAAAELAAEDNADDSAVPVTERAELGSGGAKANHVGGVKRSRDGTPSNEFGSGKRSKTNGTLEYDDTLTTSSGSTQALTSGRALLSGPPTAADLVAQGPPQGVSAAAPSANGGIVHAGNTAASLAAIGRPPLVGQPLANPAVVSVPVNGIASNGQRKTSPIRQSSLQTDKQATPTSSRNVPPRQQEQQETEPPAPLPDFIFPRGEASTLRHYLKVHTHSLNVEELEQLRAACYDCIWRARKDWDKTVLLQEIRSLAEEFISEVEDSKRAQ